MKHFLRALTLVAALGALPVHASVFDLGSLGYGLHSIGPRTTAPGSFADRWNFYLTHSYNDIASAVTDIQLNFHNTPILGINNLAFVLYDSNGYGLSGPGTLSYRGRLSDGAYYFMISGQATGIAGGEYFGSVAVAPVPEADTFALMALGTGVVLVAVRRRRV